MVIISSEDDHDHKCTGYSNQRSTSFSLGNKNKIVRDFKVEKKISV